jgi:hypothetical protein
MYGDCSGEQMLESDDGRWLTYEEAGELLGISTQAARMLSKRRGWARRTPNAYGDRAQVLVPPDLIVHPRSALIAERAGSAFTSEQPHTNGHDQANVQAIEVLREQLGVANQRADHAEQRVDEERARADRAEQRAGDERDRADRAEKRTDEERNRADRIEQRADDAQAAERIARDELAALRARGWWARLRNKR